MVWKVDNLDVQTIKSVVEGEATSPLDFSPKKSYSKIGKEAGG